VNEEESANAPKSPGNAGAAIGPAGKTAGAPGDLRPPGAPSRTALPCTGSGRPKRGPPPAPAAPQARRRRTARAPAVEVSPVGAPRRLRGVGSHPGCGQMLRESFCRR
jgi:hypothetical protein